MNEQKDKLILIAEKGNRRFEIVHDPMAGFYIFVYESGRCTHDYLQNTLQIAKEFTETKFGVPLQLWHPPPEGGDVMTNNNPLLIVRDLRISFFTDEGEVRAVDNISFSMKAGETLAVVGESGSGKSVTAMTLTRLVPSPPARYVGGEIIFKGHDTLKMSGEELRKIRGAQISYIFQEPSTSLNPVFTIRSQVAEALELHRRDIGNVDAEVERLLALVGIREPRLRMSDYPHQLSGGMQQRVMIAMALACNPSLLVADEPTTALDVTIQAQIMALLKELKQKLGMAIMLITHNFSIVADIADNIAVMFRGKIVEYGPTQRVLREPQHPYTKALLECIPRLGAHKDRLKTINHAEIEAALKR